MAPSNLQILAMLGAMLPYALAQLSVTDTSANYDGSFRHSTCYFSLKTPTCTGEARFDGQGSCLQITQYKQGHVPSNNHVHFDGCSDQWWIEKDPNFISVVVHGDGGAQQSFDMD
ncbi:MAG: hypothetical protein Q9159_007751, partial [Coniocarpon cinnabarinum]